MSKQKTPAIEEPLVKDKQAIEVTVQLDAIDMRNARFFNLFFKYKWLMLTIILLLCLAVVVIILDALAVFAFIRPIIWAAIVSVGIALSGVFLIMVISSGTTRTRRLAFTDQGVTTPGGRNNGLFYREWALLHDVRETGQYIFLYLDARQFLIIPKRYLTSEQVTAIRSFIRNQNPQAKIREH